MKLDNVVKFKNNMIKKYCNRNSIVVDATMGNGNDTLFLAQVCKNGKVHAFDVQEEAIKNTKKRCEDFTNINYYLKSHDKFSEIGVEELDFGVFNLGYLPGFNRNFTTQAHSTIGAIKQMLKILKVEGALCITLYSGHDGGVETNSVLEYIYTLDPKKYAVLQYQFLNLDKAPFVIMIEKIKK